MTYNLGMKNLINPSKKEHFYIGNTVQPKSINFLIRTPKSHVQLLQHLLPLPISFSFPPPSSPPLPTTTLHLVQEPHPHCSQTHLILVPHQFAHTRESSPTQPNQSPQHKHRKRNWIWSQRSKTPKNSFQRIRLHGHNETASTMQRLLQNKKRNGEEENKTPNIEQKIQYR